MNRVRNVWSVTPIDPIQPAPASTVNPPLYGQEAHVKPACYRTQRGATPNRGNQLSTALLGPAYLPTLTPERVFLSKLQNKLLTWIL